MDNALFFFKMYIISQIAHGFRLDVANLEVYIIDWTS